MLVRLFFCFVFSISLCDGKHFVTKHPWFIDPHFGISELGEKDSKGQEKGKPEKGGARWDMEGSFPALREDQRRGPERKTHTKGSAERASGPEKAWNRSKKRQCILIRPLEATRETTETSTHVDRAI